MKHTKMRQGILELMRTLRRETLVTLDDITSLRNVADSVMDVIYDQ
jgi:hypothetical protein